jgi:hypothetical protein
MGAEKRCFGGGLWFAPFPIAMAPLQQWRRALDPRRPFRMSGRRIFSATSVVENNHRATNWRKPRRHSTVEARRSNQPNAQLLIRLARQDAMRPLIVVVVR